MSVAHRLVGNGMHMARRLLDRFGVLAAPVRGLVEARRALTVERPEAEVRQLLLKADNAPKIFGNRTTLESTGAVGARIRWRLPGRGHAYATLRPGPGSGTELLMEVHLEMVTSGGRPRYADNAGVLALRALHRVKSLVETGEIPTLAHNPTARPVPDPYGD